MNLVVLSACSGLCNPISAYLMREIGRVNPITRLIRIQPNRPAGMRWRLRYLDPARAFHLAQDVLFYRRRFRRREEVIRRALFGDQPYPAPPPATPVAHRDLNTPATGDLLRSLETDVLLVLGAPMLKPVVYSAARIAAVNLHLGLAPFYRGEHTIFWPLYERRPDRVGFTLHRLEPRADAGPLLAHGHPAIRPDDTEAALLARMTVLAATAITAYLRQPEAPGLDQAALPDKGQLYKYARRKFWQDLQLDWRRRVQGEKLPGQVEKLVLYF